MTVERITAATFADLVAEGINTRDDTLDTRVGAYRDIFIDPVAEVFEQQNNRVVYLSSLVSMKNAANVVPDDLDEIVYNEGMVRWDGARSITTVTFSRLQPPTADIVVPVNFPLSTDVNPATGVSVSFKTIETQTMFAASPSAYYNATTGKYELAVQVTSLITGVQAQVGQNEITIMRRPLTGFDEVTNKAETDGGRGVETNAQLAERYLLHVEGSQFGTPAGTKLGVLDNFNLVEDVYVVYGNNAYLTREREDAGAVDIWIKGSAPISRSYSTAYPGIETLIETDRQPLVSVESVSTTAGGGITFIEGTDYEVATGEGEFAYSNRGSDGIRFLVGGNHPPAIDDPVTITYTYNSLIDVLSSFFSQEEYYTLGADKLYRWAQAQNIVIEASLTVASGSPPIIRAAVRTAVLTYINTLGLGMDVEEFDIDRIVATVQGVDNWTYTTLAVEDGVGVGDIEITPQKYAYLLDANFVINLV